MLKKLTGKNHNKRTKIHQERIAKACFNICDAECVFDPRYDRVSLNYIIKEI